MGDRSTASKQAALAVTTAAEVTLPAEAQQKVTQFLEAARADNTRRAYETDWNDFATWCQERQLTALPADPQTVAAYLSDRADTLKLSTLERRRAAIAHLHQLAHGEDPTKHAGVKETIKGIRRQKSVAVDQKAALLPDHVTAILELMDDGLRDRRDRALLLLGWFGGFRRSELVGLEVGDLEDHPEGYVVHLRRSKTDQEGHGQVKAIPRLPETDKTLCPVRALKAWLQAAALTGGPIFRGVDRWGKVSDKALSGRAVANIVKRLADVAGLDPDRFAGHSLRAGFATSARRAGADTLEIMRQGGWKSEAMVRRYTREEDIWHGNAVWRMVEAVRQRD